MQNTSTSIAPHPLERDSKTFYGIFVVGFLMFLLIAVVAETLAWKWRSWLPGAEGNHSLITDVKGAVYTFMSHIL